MKILIVLNGKINNYSRIKQEINNFSPDYIICADGAYRHLKSMKTVPNMLVGDFDSINSELITEAHALGIDILKVPAEKDFIDGELAIREALKLKPQKVLIIGGFGGRVDHTLANIHLLNIILENGIEGEIFDERGKMVLIDKHTKFIGIPGQVISILPFSASAYGVTLNGLKYKLENAIVEYGNPYGVSNEFLKDEADVFIEKGKLLVIIQNP